MLSVKHLTKTFKDKAVINNISFDVPKGSIAVFLGPSGVGKSTLLRVLSNLEKKDAGTIHLHGKSIEPTQLIKDHVIGMVFQQFNLFDHLTVEENITIPLIKAAGIKKDAAQKKAAALLASYGLSDKARKYPHELSGGQKQRLALARALALEPQIICLDEPTSALDPLLTSHIAQEITQLAQDGYIVVIATHDTSLVERLPCTIYLMSEGKIAERVTSQELKDNPSKYERINAFIKGEA